MTIATIGTPAPMIRAILAGVHDSSSARVRPSSIALIRSACSTSRRNRACLIPSAVGTMMIGISRATIGMMSGSIGFGSSLGKVRVRSIEGNAGGRLIR